MEGASIVIAEDEAVVALDLRAQLEELGYRVVAVTATGKQTLRAVEQLKPALVLMDIVLKGPQDGIETAEIIRRGLRTPVVFLTAFSDAETVHRAVRTAPYGYLTKPYQLRELRAAIEVALYKATVERQLSESERWFSSTLRCIDDGVIVTEPDSYVRFLNPAAERMTGWSAAEAAGKQVGAILRFFGPSGAPEGDQSARSAMLENRVIGVDLARPLQRRDGSELPVDESAAPVQDEHGELLGAVVVLRDATARLHFEHLLRESEARFRSAFDFAPVGMALVALDGRFVQVNGALCQFLGYSRDELLAVHHGQLTCAPDVERERQFLLELVAGKTAVAQFEKRYQHRDGTTVLWALVSVSLLRKGGAPMCYLYQIHDLTERKEAEYRLTRLAYDDPLTGLRNRAGLRDDLERLLGITRRNREQLAVVFLDLDRFKQINDSLGHEAGDRLLQEVARRLTASLRESDCIARLGGDEFVLALPGLRSTELVVDVLEKVRLTISEPILLGSREVVVTPSLGVSLYPDDANDAEMLLRCADSALYKAKAEGRNRVTFFHPELTQQAEERLGLESALRGALARRELFIEYQPIVRLRDEAVVAVEALLRWRHGEACIDPEVFVPITEEIGLIHAIGRWVIAEACALAARWPTPVCVNVNCSAYQFREDGFAAEVAAALQESGLAARRLSLEITEGIMLKGDETQIARLSRVKALGVQLAIDDYGTGYSPLAYLKRYSPESLKIDAMFIADIERDPSSAAIVRATIAMGHSLGIRVVAEGVETAAQEHTLRQLGCDMAQGFLYSKAVSSEAIGGIVGRGRLPPALR